MSYQELKIIIEPSYKSGAALGTVTIKDCKFVDFKCDNCASLAAELEALRAALAEADEPDETGLYHNRIHEEMPNSRPAYAVRAEADEPVAWRTEAAAWLRRQADDAESDSERTGWANPAHHMPATLRRIAEKLDAEQEAAPFGMDCLPSPRREPLTEEQIDALCTGSDGLPASHIEFARAIERAHGIGGDE